MTQANTTKKQKLDITEILLRIIEQISANTSSFSHIDTKKILVCLASNKSNTRGGIYGKLVPLKFKNGSDILRFHGKHYTMPAVINNGIRLLYIVYFYIPKFFDLSPFEKLRIIFHELYHISPEFNGDIRRMGEVKKAHGSSKKKFDLYFEKDARSFYEYIMDTEYMDFLKMDTVFLNRNYKVYARRMKIPKPVIIKPDQKT